MANVSLKGSERIPMPGARLLAPCDPIRSPGSNRTGTAPRAAGTCRAGGGYRVRARVGTVPEPR